MPLLHNIETATWNASDYAKFVEGYERMKQLLEFPSNHFTSGEIIILKAMAKKLNEIADLFEDDFEPSPLVGYEVNGLSGLRASMGVNGNNTTEVNRSRLWDGTAYLTELNSDDY